MHEKTGIILVNFHGLADTLECLHSLSKVNGAFTTFVVNVESDPELKPLEKHTIKPTVISMGENRGYSASNNTGIRAALKAGCTRIVLLNNDTFVDSHFLAPLLAQLENPKVGMVSPLIYFAKGREYHQEDYASSERGKVVWYAGGVIDWRNVHDFHWGINEVDHGQYRKVQATDFATGCCMAIRAEVINSVGMFDETFFLYNEDSDWSVRVHKAGYQILIEPQSIIWHVNSGSTGGPKADISRYYRTKSRIRFAMKHAPWRTKLAIFREAMKNSRKQGIEGAANRHALKGRYGKTD